MRDGEGRSPLVCLGAGSMGLGHPGALPKATKRNPIPVSSHQLRFSLLGFIFSVFGFVTECLPFWRYPWLHDATFPITSSSPVKSTRATTLEY